MAKANKINISRGDRTLYTVVNIVLILITLLTLYPILYVLSSSISDPDAISSGEVFLLPVGFSLEGYRVVFENKAVVTGFLNSVFYTVAGTAINIVMTILAAYPLSRPDLMGRSLFIKMFTVTMLIGGGMIPNYILIKNLHMIDTRWALLIPGAIATYNMIVAKTFFQTNIPRDLLEAAQIDGCSDYKFLMKIVLPLSKAIIAVLTIYYAVGHWNSYFNAFLYLTDKKLFPLQIVLREILVMSQISAASIEDPELADVMQGLADSLKYSLIVISSVPILLIYPFAQKYFVKGVMIGSIKG